jgi:hypothetical protein
MSLPLLLSSFGFCQQGSGTPAQSDPPAKSLGEIAKESRNTNIKHSKKLITNEELDATHGPLPRLKLEDDDNTEEVIRAIGDYRSNHSPEETERVVHEWYDEYDGELADSIREGIRMKDRRESTVYNGYWTCQSSPNYQNCEIRRRAEMRGSHDDQISSRGNGFLTGRLQQSLMKIRTEITRFRLQYDWFKIRNGNGVGSF